MIVRIREAYPDLGKCLYFDLGWKTHTVLYELLNKKLNWIWYVNQPEPQLKVEYSQFSSLPSADTCFVLTRSHISYNQGNSVTMRVSEEMIKKMHQEADTVWHPELARLMKETNEPFLNVIYDHDPLEQIVWDNVVLVGDAAHPTTPHGLRSTNMSVLDAFVLGKCLEKRVQEGLRSGLEEYQRIRVTVVSEQVLHSRRLGRVKQGLDGGCCVSGAASGEVLEELKQRNMPFFSNAPLV